MRSMAETSSSSRSITEPLLSVDLSETFGAGAAVVAGFSSVLVPMDGNRPSLASRSRRRLSSARICTRTRATPCFWKPRSLAPSLERSMILPGMKGPRSLTRTTMERPLSRLVTRTAEGIGRVLWAAETTLGLNISPFAVGRPPNSSPYQDAIPVSS